MDGSSVLVGIRGAGRYVKASLPAGAVDGMDVLIESICRAFGLGKEVPRCGGSTGNSGFIVSIWVVVPTPSLSLGQRRRLPMMGATQLRGLLSRPYLEDRMLEVDIRHLGMPSPLRPVDRMR